MPAVAIASRSGALTLVDSTLRGQAGAALALDCAGSMLLRGIDVSGYAVQSIRCQGERRTVSRGDELSSRSLGQPSPQPLIDAEESPEYWSSHPGDWVAVGQRLPGEKDDTAAIQRALDSGKPIIYFQNTRTYFISDTLVIRGHVRKVLGMFAEISLGAAKEPFDDPQEPRPLIRIDETAADAVFLERLFFNAQYRGEVIFENNSPRTLIVRHCGGWVGSGGDRRAYRNTSRATGKVFIEDVFLPGWQFTRQQVWARQLNPENMGGDGRTPQVANIAGRLWILGFKTEGPAPFLRTTAGGLTELLGAYNYVSATDAPAVPPEAVPYIVMDAEASLSFLTDNFRSSDYRVYIEEVQKGSVRHWRPADLPPRNGNPDDASRAVPVYHSSSP